MALIVPLTLTQPIHRLTLWSSNVNPNGTVGSFPSHVVLIRVSVSRCKFVLVATLHRGSEFSWRDMSVNLIVPSSYHSTTVIIIHRNPAQLFRRVNQRNETVNHDLIVGLMLVVVTGRPAATDNGIWQQQSWLSTKPRLYTAGT